MSTTNPAALWAALQRGNSREVAKQLFPQESQQPRNRSSYAPVEDSSPTDDAGTVGVVDPNYCRICTPKGYGYCRCDIASNE